ncbi:MAG: hypothetical protein ACAH80_11310 [Alphaproteobacteria bacterium]
MGYIENNLVKDEQVVETGLVHPFVFVPGFIVAGLGALFAATPEIMPVPVEIKTPFYVGGGVLLLWAAWLLGSAAIIKATTVMALTTRRIINGIGGNASAVSDIRQPQNIRIKALELIDAEQKKKS